MFNNIDRFEDDTPKRDPAEEADQIYDQIKNGDFDQ